jgi:hypothetical protein
LTFLTAKNAKNARAEAINAKLPTEINPPRPSLRAKRSNPE